jgi:hypothetical protein
MMMQRASLLVDGFVTEQKNSKSLSWCAEQAIQELQEMESARKTWDEGKSSLHLPCPVVPKFQHQVVYQITKQLREEVAEDAAIEGQCRSLRLKKHKILKVTKACDCPYCVNPNHFQTQAYQRLAKHAIWSDFSVVGEDDIWKNTPHAKKHRRATISANMTVRSFPQVKTTNDVKQPKKKAQTRASFSVAPSWVTPTTNQRKQGWKSGMKKTKSHSTPISEAPSWAQNGNQRAQKRGSVHSLDLGKKPRTPSWASPRNNLRKGSLTGGGGSSSHSQLSPAAAAAMAMGELQNQKSSLPDKEETNGGLPIWATPKGRRRLFGTNRKLDSDVDEEELFEKDVMADLIIKYQLTNTKRRHRFHRTKAAMKKRGSAPPELPGVAPPPFLSNGKTGKGTSPTTIGGLAPPPFLDNDAAGVAPPPLFSRNDRWMDGSANN